MLRIAIVDPNDESREALCGMLLGVDFVWLESQGKNYDFFLDVIQQNVPDLVIANLDGDKTKSLVMIEQLANTYPKLPILAISSDNQSLLAALKKGAKFFLTQPVVLEELLEALRNVGNGGQTPAKPGAVRPQAQTVTVTAVLGSRGGVGCTTLAVNLGATLAADPTNHVALLDLDLALGDCDVALDMMPDLTMTDLVMNLEKLDMNFMKRSLIKHEGSGLSVLCHPIQIAEIEKIHPDHLKRIVSLLRVSYNHLILDLSKSLAPTDVEALHIADKILLVAQLELSSLRNVVRILHTLNAIDLGSKVHVVMNRVGADYAEADINLKKAEDTIGKPIYWQVPNDAKAVIGARNVGMPLLAHAPKSRAQQSIQGLAAALTNRTAAAAAPPAKRGWFK
jgi:pilus assembly protein CpaE